jgi:hypothetical protein
VLREDGVVRYKNRLLQLERQTQHWAPAQSRVLVRENQAGEIAIHYREQRLPSGFYGEAQRKGRCPSPGTPIPKTQTQTCSGQQSSLAPRLAANENTGFFVGMVKPQPGTFLLWKSRGHFYCGMTFFYFSC